MRVLLLDNGREPDISEVRGYPGVMAWFLAREFRAAGVELVYGRLAPANQTLEQDLASYAEPFPPADHVLSVHQKAFHNRLRTGCRCPLLEAVRRACPTGCVGTLCDHALDLGPEDVTFYHSPGPRPLGGCYVGCAADPAQLRPQIFPRVSPLAVLIDHAYYGSHRSIADYTRLMVRCALRPPGSFERMNVRIFASDGDFDLTGLDEPPEDIFTYNRRGLTWPQAASLYRWADVFLVTHGESLGLSVIEAATAGALIVAPEGTIRREILHLVEHLEVPIEDLTPERFPWQAVWTMASASTCRGRAVEAFDRWPAMAKIILDYFGDCSDE